MHQAQGGDTTQTQQQMQQMQQMQQQMQQQMEQMQQMQQQMGQMSQVREDIQEAHISSVMMMFNHWSFSILTRCQEGGI